VDQTWWAWNGGVVFWVMTSSRLPGGYRCFGGLSCLHLHSRNYDGGKILYRNVARHLADHTVSSLIVSLHSSVRIGISLRAERPEVRLRPLLITQAPMVPGCLPGIKRPEYEASHSAPLFTSQFDWYADSNSLPPRSIMPALPCPSRHPLRSKERLSSSCLLGT